jgi:hypothetical protein
LAIWKDVSGRLGQPTLPGKKTLQRGPTLEKRIAAGVPG